MYGDDRDETAGPDGRGETAGPAGPTKTPRVRQDTPLAEVEEMDADALTAEIEKREAEMRVAEQRAHLAQLRAGIPAATLRPLFPRPGGSLAQGFNPQQDSAGTRGPLLHGLPAPQRVRPNPPTPYDGTDTALLPAFIREAEVYFRAMGYDLSNPLHLEIVIPTAATYVQGLPLTLYDLATQDQLFTTWHAFTSFLKSTASDLETRRMDATRRAQYARQKIGQTVREFFFELREAQKEVSELGMNADELAAWRFIHGLNDNIKAGILSETAESRSNLAAALAAANRHEEREKRKRKKEEIGKKSDTPQRRFNHASNPSQFNPNRTGPSRFESGNSHQPRNEANDKPRPSTNTSTNNSQPQGDSAARMLRCHNCREPGHTRPNCPKLTNGKGKSPSKK